jgi:hypothetical protein
MSWPPTLIDLKNDMKIDLPDNRDDVRLQTNLTAAVAFVARVRGGDYKFDPTDPAQFDLPVPSADTELGTLRLAARWYTRPRSPDGIIDAGELGGSRVPSFDPDIDRLLRIGRHQRGRVG